MNILPKLKYGFVLTFILMYGISLLTVLPQFNLQSIITPIILFLTISFLVLFGTILFLQTKHKVWRPVKAIDYGVIGIMCLYILQIIAKLIV